LRPSRHKVFLVLDIVKHNRAGKGLGVHLFMAKRGLEDYVHGPDFEQSVDGITLVQEYIESADPFCVTLNRTPAIETSRIIRRMNYEHPVYDMSAFDAQRKHDRISGVRHTHYCGAYWGYGFHEDGVRSALRVCARFGLEL